MKYKTKPQIKELVESIKPIQSITLTTTDGKVTGGTVKYEDGSTTPITVSGT